MQAFGRNTNPNCKQHIERPRIREANNIQNTAQKDPTSQSERDCDRPRAGWKLEAPSHNKAPPVQRVVYNDDRKSGNYDCHGRSSFVRLSLSANTAQQTSDGCTTPWNL